MRHWRTERGLTLRELAETASLSERFVAEVEAGRGNPSILNLSQIADALGLSTASLLAEAESLIDRPIVALVGLRGAGKTTLGQALAARLDRPFIELDALVERQAGMPLASLFSLYDERAYRRLELDALRGLLATHPRVVLATGGGIVTSPESWQLLVQQCRVVWLKARAEDYWQRVIAQGDHRPMAHRAAAMTELKALLKAREPLYARAHSVIDTSALGLEGSLEALVTEVKG